MLSLSITSTRENAFHWLQAFEAPSCRRPWLTALYGDSLSSSAPSATAATIAANANTAGMSHAGRRNLRPEIAAAPISAMAPATTTEPAAPTTSGKITERRHPIPAPTRLTP